MLIFCCPPAVSFAQPPRIGGYDVARIAVATMDALKTKGVLGDADIVALSCLLGPGSATDPLVAAQSIVEFYGKLGAVLVVKKTLTTVDVESAKIPARESGGMKASGLNPVVLAASFLDALGKKGIVSIDAAQAILDGARVK